MRIQIKTDFGAEFDAEVIKVTDTEVHYKVNETDESWNTIPAKNVRTFQLRTEHDIHPFY